MRVKQLFQPCVTIDCLAADPKQMTQLKNKIIRIMSNQDLLFQVKIVKVILDLHYHQSLKQDKVFIQVLNSIGKSIWESVMRQKLH